MINIKNIMRKFFLTILCVCCTNAYVLAGVPVPVPASFSVSEGAVSSSAFETAASPSYEEKLPSVLKGRVVTVPVGSSFTAKMQSSVSSASLKPGDNIAAVLTADWTFQGLVIAPEGSILYGKVTQVEQAGNAYKSGKFELRFNEVITPEGQSIQLSSNTYALAVDSKRPLKIAGTVGKGIFLGALTGAARQISTDDDNNSSDSSGNTAVLVGAAIGLIGGVMNVISSRGEEVELPRNTLINVKLSEPIVVNAFM